VYANSTSGFVVGVAVTAQSAILQGRAAAEAIMQDMCTITRVTGEPGQIDPDTGEREPAPTTTVYAGKCRVQTYEPQESTPDSGAHTYTVQRYAIHVPVGTSAQVDDDITVTASVMDPDLVGRKYVVTALLHKTFATANRLAVEEIVR
jgi:hypothetical protein